MLVAGACSAETRIGAYTLTRSWGAPFVVNGVVDTNIVKYYAYFDDVTLDATPWGEDVNNAPRADVPFLLRKYNPKIRIWLYVMPGDFWLSPNFVPNPSDLSAYRDMFDAISSTNGWLWGTDGLQWLDNNRVDVANKNTMKALGDVYERLIKTKIYDGIFMDNTLTSIAWQDGTYGRHIDYKRAGFQSLAAMDSARYINIVNMIDRMKKAGGPSFLTSVNTLWPRPYNLDVDFKEGLGSLNGSDLNTVNQWVTYPGWHWLKGECYNSSDCSAMSKLLKSIAAKGNVIIYCGPDREWPPYQIPR